MRFPASLAIMAVLSGLAIASVPLSVVTISASDHYDFGLQLGQVRGPLIRSWIEDSSTMKSKLLPWFQHNQKTFTHFKATVENELSWAADELRGMAKGAEVDESMLWLLMLRPEIVLLTKAEHQEGEENIHDTSMEGCSDVYSHHANILAHNEDGDCELFTSACIVEADIASTGQNFVSYTYTGLLPGMAFSWSNSGLFALTVNAVSPRHVDLDGMPRFFLTRAALGADSADSAAAVAESMMSIASGSSINIVDFESAFNIEVAAGFTTSKAKSDLKGLIHFNEYHRLEVDQWPSTSTQHRMARYLDIGHPKSEQEVLQLLGDEMDSDYPIYRRGHAPDSGCTVATALFDFEYWTWSVWTDNPAESGPVKTWQMI